MSLATTLIPSFVRRSYLAKFVLAILVVVLVMSVVGAGSYVFVDNTVQEDANAELETTAEMQADEISSWMESLSVQTRTASDSPILQDGDPQEVQAHLVEEQARMGVNVRAIHYLDTDSDEVVTSTTAAYRDRPFTDLEEPWSDHDFDAEFLLDEEIWHTPEAYESPTLDDQVMAFASPVTDRDDRVVVVIGTLEYQIEQLQQDDISQSTVILDADGNDVFQADHVAVDADDESLEAALGGRIQLLSDDDRVHSYVPVSNTQWVAVSSIPTDEAYGVAASVGNNILLMIAFNLGALSLIGVVLGRQTVGPITTLRDRAAAMEAGNLDVDLETNRTDEIGQLFDGFDSMRTSLREQIEEAEAAREEAEQKQEEATEAQSEAEKAKREAEAEREELERMTNHLERKAEEFSTTMAACADGDLSRRLDPESESDAMTDIAVAFNGMVDQLESTVADVKAFANEVAAASEQVTASAQEVQAASQQVSESVQEISDGAENQNESLQTVDREMESLSTTTEEIAASSNEVADMASRMAETGRDGREAAEEAISGMHEIEDESEEAVDAIRDLETKMAQVDELVELITDIARETNMLALNANIEAARGDGSDGAGFDVVATQVKELAADTKSTAEEIEDRLDRINDQTAETVADVERTAARISEHVDSVEDAATALDEIATHAENTNDGIQEISAATEQQTASTQEILAMISSATEIAESTAEESQSVAAAAEEQTSALSEVSQSASSLANQASQLSETLDQFELEKTGENVPETRGDREQLEAPETGHKTESN
ncbi:methyl-accepting chemotaxis protein [Natronobacterium gregoryi]|uniref:Methyl-accepting chemotaxis protein n=2 Tax=Natronobacterium gregoryi TaxID=44930 RepID=L0AH10_NATGS|nr:methyl-accepting chemotaxis protein [Natronobacterium gregoryi]AFZ73173.1 methyl-accepting chemotaxis protein [Natronobacterium gregoryi SP2]ELY71101.1 methyl-accepting chemotaxis sensory transducer [Natronobacterium gregoryi SP2]PLK21584.1 methyl-accepting chemotaxis protein [Natronobacterium gregoryi SP2]SFI59508.1 methyl-accepting chemotaxis protein [Natronobacterium gregoryi]